MEIVFSDEDAPTLEFAGICLGTIDAEGLLSGATINDRPYQQYRDAIGGRKAFELRADLVHARMGWVANFSHGFIRVCGVGTTASEQLLNKTRELVQVVSVRWFDEDYEFWQNAHDPLQFQSRGRTLDGVQLVSNGLPPPLERNVVDISTNPGRRLLRRGYVEGIGHRMVLTEHFFERVPGSHRERVLLADWCEVHSMNNGSIEIVFTRSPFQEGDGSEPLQNKARELVFGSQD